MLASMREAQNMLVVTALVVALSFSQSAKAATPDAQVAVVQGLANHWGLALGTDVCNTTWLGCSTDGDVTGLVLYAKNVTGSIPESLGDLTNLSRLDLRFNNLSGSIPEALGSLRKLTFLHLSHNNLTGSIPNNLGALPNLTTLGLNSNNLTGSIPESLGNMTQLLKLYLNDNFLTGSVPQFQVKPTRFDTANNCLANAQDVQRPKSQCSVPTPAPAPGFGFPPPPPLIVPAPVPGVATPPLAPSGSPRQTSSPTRGWVWAVIAAVVVVSIVAVVAAAFCLARSRRSTNESAARPERLELFALTNYTAQELRSMTDRWSEEKLLGRGGFGSVYECVDPKGERVAVKRLNREKKSSNNRERDDFVNEVKMLSSVRHPNLVTLHGYCYHQGERMLVMSFVDNKSLADHLFSNKGNEVPSLRWGTRCNILLTSAEALRYLHSLKIIHRDFKPQNILLDSSFNSVVGDFGLARQSEQVMMTTSVGGTVGYMAPDITVTDKVDVYSFGVVLLEIVTGASCSCRYALGGDPSDSMSVDDAAWLVCTSRPRALLRLVDHAIANEVPDGEAISMLRLAILCIDKEPSNRPTMEEVVAMLNKYLEVPPLPRQQRHWLGSGTDGSTFSMSKATISTGASNLTHRHSMAQDGS